MQPRPDDAELHVCSLQSSVAEGHADSGKAGPPARSALPARSHLQRTTETALTECPSKNAHEDKAWDPERVTMRTTGALTSTANPSITPHAAEMTGHDYSSTDRHTVGKAIAQPVSLHTLPIKPGGAMIPTGSQDRRTVGCATAPNTAGTPNATENRPPRPSGRTADEQGSTSAQAVKRGHQVAMIKVPDEEDDTAYQRWLAKGSPIVTPT